MVDRNGNPILPGSVIDASDSFGIYPPGIVLADGVSVYWLPWFGEGASGGLGKLGDAANPADADMVWAPGDVRVLDPTRVDWAGWSDMNPLAD